MRNSGDNFREARLCSRVHSQHGLAPGFSLKVVTFSMAACSLSPAALAWLMPWPAVCLFPVLLCILLPALVYSHKITIDLI